MLTLSGIEVSLLASLDVTRNLIFCGSTQRYLAKYKDPQISSVSER
jgi:hypothetical protein